MEPKNLAEIHKQELLIRMRRSAFIAVVLSTVAILSCVIGLPLAYSYVQQVQSNMYNEIEFCKVSLLLLADLISVMYFFFLLDSQQRLVE